MLILTESSKSPASIAQSNKQGTCLYQEWYKPLLISCEAAIRLWASSEADCEYPLWHADKHSPASSVRSTKRRVECLCQWEWKLPLADHETTAIHEQVAKLGSVSRAAGMDCECPLYNLCFSWGSVENNRIRKGLCFTWNIVQKVL